MGLIQSAYNPDSNPDYPSRKQPAVQGDSILIKSLLRRSRLTGNYYIQRTFLFRENDDLYQTLQFHHYFTNVGDENLAESSRRLELRLSCSFEAPIADTCKNTKPRDVTLEDGVVGKKRFVRTRVYSGRCYSGILETQIITSNSGHVGAARG